MQHQKPLQVLKLKQSYISLLYKIKYSPFQKEIIKNSTNSLVYKNDVGTSNSAPEGPTSSNVLLSPYVEDIH